MIKMMFSAEYVAEFFTINYQIAGNYECIEGLPKGCKIYDAGFDIAENTCYVYFLEPDEKFVDGTEESSIIRDYARVIKPTFRMSYDGT